MNLITGYKHLAIFPCLVYRYTLIKTLGKNESRGPFGFIIVCNYLIIQGYGRWELADRKHFDCIDWKAA
jgi:hypothetical protein